MLWDALHAAAPPTPVACSACINQQQQQQVPLQYPEVSVSGVGLLKLPLPADQAAGLKAVAQQAPHGKGMETVVDTTVRDALQVSSGPVQRGEPLYAKLFMPYQVCPTAAVHGACLNSREDKGSTSTH